MNAGNLIEIHMWFVYHHDIFIVITFYTFCTFEISITCRLWVVFGRRSKHYHNIFHKNYHHLIGWWWCVIGQQICIRVISLHGSDQPYTEPGPTELVVRCCKLSGNTHCYPWQVRKRSRKHRSRLVAMWLHIMVRTLHLTVKHIWHKLVQQKEQTL